MVAEVDQLAADGLVRVSRHAVLRCGDAWTGASEGGDTLDCPGEIEMPYGSVDATHPFVQDEGAAHACSYCGRVWRPGRTALPLFLRVRVDVDHARAWAWVIERVRKRSWVEAQAPGLAAGRFGDKTVFLVYVPLATDPIARSVAHAAAFPTCWVGQPVPKGYRERGVELADLLADDEVPVTRAWRLGRDRGLQGQGEPEVPLLCAEPSPVVARLQTRKPRTRTFLVDEAGVWLDGQPLTDARATSTRMLLALLWEAARADDANGRRKLRTTRKIATMCDLKLTDKAVYTWVNRLRERIGQVSPGDVDELVVSERGRGYRLGEGVVCVGVDLREEVARFRAALLRGQHP